MRQTPYEKLALLPNIIAEAVCARPYKGQEWSDQNRDPVRVEKIEALRRQMTPDQIREFADLADARCRAAYGVRATWFVECIRAEGDAGRDQLAIWITHWLAAYLFNPGGFRHHVRQAG